jgi:hypothetical protein
MDHTIGSLLYKAEHSPVACIFVEDMAYIWRIAGALASVRGFLPLRLLPVSCIYSGKILLNLRLVSFRMPSFPEFTTILATGAWLERSMNFFGPRSLVRTKNSGNTPANRAKAQPAGISVVAFHRPRYGHESGPSLATRVSDLALTESISFQKIARLRTVCSEQC